MSEQATSELMQRVDALVQRVERMEGSMIFLYTTQPQKVDALEETATTSEVRSAVIQIAAALRTLGLGA